MNNLFRSLSGQSRAALAGVVAVTLVLSVLFVPPLRAMADQFLQVFRVQNVVFVPINSERIEELENLDFDEETLFVSEPTAINEPGEPRTVADADEAAEHVDFTPKEVDALPNGATMTEMLVLDRATYEFEVNVEASQQLLEMMNINETFPEELGDGPITADLPASVSMLYSGDEYELMFHQGLSPEVTLPEGVDLAKLGKVVLLLLGMEENQAEALSQEIDWSTTLIFPFRADLSDIRQVKINGADGLLTSGYDDYDGESKRWKTLYWQDGERFYVLVSEGTIGIDAMLDAAESLQ